MILQIVEEIGNNYNRRGKEPHLYQYLDNKIDVYFMDNASNLVMKNFVAFIFNPDSLEKFDNFLASKDVDERWMAFSFWGAYNGFANISRNYTRDIYNVSNIELQNQIDSYLKEYLKTMLYNKPYVTKHDISKPVRGGFSDAKDEKEINKFFDLFVAGQYNLTLDQVRTILILDDQKKFQDKLKLKYNIIKKDSTKLVGAMKKYFYPIKLFR